MNEYINKRISEHMTAIQDPQNVMLFLIEGAERALVIDTGYGVLNPREYIETLTDKPYEVICTHGHGDHILGMKHFEWAYLPKKDFDVLGAAKHWSHLEPKFKPLLDGAFDLGGVTVKCLELAGHTPGIVAVLVEEDRVILLGDACNTHTWMFFNEASTIAEFKKSLENFKLQHFHKFDKVVLSHGETAKVYAPEIIDECIEVCALILNEKKKKIPYTYNNFDGNKIKVAMPTNEHGNRADGKSANIMYHVDKVR